MIGRLHTDDAILLGHALVGRLARDRGIRCLSVTGPVLEAQDLRDAHRSGDVDVLVEPARLADLLTELHLRGWRERPGMSAPRILPLHSVTLLHDQWPCDIDVHHAFPGFLAPSDRVFDELWARRLPAELAGAAVLVADPVANSAVLALHALRHPAAVRGRRELDGLVHRWSSGRADLSIDALLRLADTTDATATLAPFLTRLGVPPPQNVQAYADWVLHPSNAHRGRTLAWVRAFRSTPLHRRHRLLAEALWPAESGFRAEHPEVGPSAAALRRARLTRLRIGLSRLPRALLSR